MKIAFVFPGYGSHYVGMAKDFYDEYRIVQEYFEEASSCLGVNVVKLCFASSEHELGKMAQAQTAIFLVSSALYKLLEQENIQPELVIGYNTGMYSALFAAHSITFPDGLYLLGKYATLYQEAIATLDVAIVRLTGVPAHTVEEWCVRASTDTLQYASVAVYLQHDEHIVSGNRAAVDQVVAHALQVGGTVQHLDTGFGLHSSLLDTLCDTFALYLNKVDFKAPMRTMVNMINGRLVTTESDARAQVVDVINKPIRIQHMLDVLPLYDLIVEIGPGTYLSTIIKKHFPDKKVMAINRRADLDGLMSMTQEAA